jgi:hypothetical protein
MACSTHTRMSCESERPVSFDRSASHFSMGGGTRSPMTRSPPTAPFCRLGMYGTVTALKVFDKRARRE